jgi:hypothetical protein
MPDNDRPFSIPAVRKTVARVGAWRMACWFVTIQAPISVVLQLLFNWLDPKPGPPNLWLRGWLALGLFGAGMTLFVWLVARAARIEVIGTNKRG